MLRRFADLLRLAGSVALAVAFCAAFSLLFKELVQETAGTPELVTEAVEQPLDVLMVMDFSAGVRHFIRVECSSWLCPGPAVRVLPDDMRDLPLIGPQPIDTGGRTWLLRDVHTGELRPASGIWCWDGNRGAPAKIADDLVVLDVDEQVVLDMPGAGCHCSCC